jgi:hypothetical protein
MMFHLKPWKRIAAFILTLMGAAALCHGQKLDVQASKVVENVRNC